MKVLDGELSLTVTSTNVSDFLVNVTVCPSHAKVAVPAALHVTGWPSKESARFTPFVTASRSRYVNSVTGKVERYHGVYLNSSPGLRVSARYTSFTSPLKEVTFTL